MSLLLIYSGFTADSLSCNTQIQDCANNYIAHNSVLVQLRILKEVTVTKPPDLSMGLSLFIIYFLQ